MVDAPRKDDRGIHLIALYKGIKAVVQIILAIALVVASGEKTLGQVHDYLIDLQQHVVSAWSQHLVAWIVKMVTPGHVHFAALVCGVDAILSGVEGWALHTRRVWGEWLVVFATGGLIPFELYEIIEKPKVGRALLMVVNIGVVWYLARRQWRRHAYKKERADGLPAEGPAANISSQPGTHLERPVQSVAADARD